MGDRKSVIYLHISTAFLKHEVTLNKKMRKISAYFLFCFSIFMDQIRWSFAGNGEPFAEKGQKNYEEDEEGKIIPHRTFLTTVEIVVICVFTVLLVFLLIALGVYLYFYGCNKAPWLQRRNKDYTQVQLQRERKIGEIWKNGHVQRA